MVREARSPQCVDVNRRPVRVAGIRCRSFRCHAGWQPTPALGGEYRTPRACSAEAAFRSSLPRPPDQVDPCIHRPTTETRWQVAASVYGRRLSVRLNGGQRLGLDDFAGRAERPGACVGRLAAAPELALARLALGATRHDAETYFLDEIDHYVYAEDTALHIAAAYEADLVRELVSAGGNVAVANRRGAEPLHYAVDGIPGSPDGTRHRNGSGRVPGRARR